MKGNIAECELERAWERDCCFRKDGQRGSFWGGFIKVKSECLKEAIPVSGHQKERSVYQTVISTFFWKG